MTLRKVPSIPPQAWKPLVGPAGNPARPVERFLATEASSGFLVLAAVAVALLWANSPWGDTYAHFWHAPFTLRVGSVSLERTLEWVVDEGLMIGFFFLGALELRRELQRGELSEPRRAALPVAAALGGLIVPAVLQALLSGGRAGWSVPMGSDVALPMALLALLGPRVPTSLRVLLLAAAVFGQLGVSLVIALFHSEGSGFGGLFVAIAGVAIVFLLQRLGVRRKAAYLAPALVTLAGVTLAGLHPAIAGVILGLMTPVEARLGPRGFAWRLQRELKILERNGPDQQLELSLREVAQTRREAMSPADALIELLHPVVALGIVPLFALANAGVSLRGLSFAGASAHVSVAIALALVLGKPLGVLLACAVALEFRLVTLPAGLRPRQLAVLGTIAGVGFTLTPFLARLSFPEAGGLASAKVGILIGNALAAALTLGLGRWLFPAPPRTEIR